MLGWLGKTRWDEAIIEFDRAIGLAPTWAEPQLEKIEKLILLNRYTVALDNIGQYLVRAGNNHRVRLILLANRIVARVLSEPNYPSSDEYRRDLDEAERIKLPDSQREDWNMKEVREVLLSSNIAKDVTMPLSDWLKSLEERLKVDPR